MYHVLIQKNIKRKDDETDKAKRQEGRVQWQIDDIIIHYTHIYIKTLKSFVLLMINIFHIHIYIRTLTKQKKNLYLFIFI